MAGHEGELRRGPARWAIGLLGVLIAATFGAGMAALAVRAGGEEGPGSPQAALRGYYAALRAGDCERAASFVDPEFQSPQELCEEFERTRQLSGELRRIVEADIRGDRATLIAERSVAGLADRRIVTVNRADGGWRLAGGSSCFPVEHPEDLGGAHLEEGEEFDGYSSSPPTSGPHAPEAAQVGVSYRDPQPLAPIVHAMEHGTVVFWVGDVPPAFRARIETVVRTAALRGYEAVIVAPLPDLDVPLAMTAWGSLRRCIGIDPLEMTAFLDDFYGSGLEGALACQGRASDLPACLGV